MRSIKIEKRKFHFNKNFAHLDGILEKNKVVLAGGALRKIIDHKDVTCDYDIFFLDQSRVDTTLTALNDHGYTKVFECPRGKLHTYIQGSNKIQICSEFFYQDYETLLKSFDFYACMFLYDGDKMYFYPQSVRDVTRKIVTINRVTYPVATMNRLMKYNKKGYYVGDAIKTVLKAYKTQEFTEEEHRFYID